MKSSILRQVGKTSWRSLLNKSQYQTTTTRTMAFKPRRTPPPSIAGVNLKPRPDPMATINKTNQPKTPANYKPLGGAGREDGWVSPWHYDYYNRLDDSTMDHPELMHGDPHMPIQRLSNGEGKLVLNPMGGKVKELNDYNVVGSGDLFTNDLETSAMEDYHDDGLDELEQEYGSDAANAIRQHLNQFHTRLETAEKKSGEDGNGTKTYSPLDEVEEKFRQIDRITAAQGSTQDLALRRRARTEDREFFRLGRIPKLSEGDNTGDEFDDEDGLALGTGGDTEEDEFGHGRSYDADSVFSKGATVKFPYSKDLPSPTYHPDFPKGSNVGNNPNDPVEEKWMQELNKIIYEEQSKELELGEIDETYSPVNVQKEDMDKYLKEQERTKKYNLQDQRDDHEKDREEKPDQILEMIKNGEDPNQEAFGPWGECTIKVDRVQKVERGGTTVRYRALVIGGNGNGAAGFGIGKALTPNDAIEKACKHAKRNVFYVDRYLGTGLSYDLAGKHNSCRVRLRAVSPDYGLHGHPLIIEILKYAGISDATGKSHGNRNPYNVVYATFKALMTHESLEDIAMKRGKKLLNLQRARRLGV